MAPTLYQLPRFTSAVGIAAIIFGLLLLVYLAERFFCGQPLPADIPLVREPEGARRFGLRTRLAYWTDCKGLYRDAYDNYAKKGKAVIVPGVGFRCEVILPTSSMRWIMAQPENVLSVGEAFSEIDMARWSLGHEIIIIDAWQGNLVRTELNRSLENTSAVINDELRRVFDEYFGSDTENWKEIDLLPTINLIVAQAAARFTVGFPLCRNKDYIRLVLDINQLLLMNAGLTGMMPRAVQPLIGTLANLPLRRKLAKLKRYLVPQWDQRLETLKFDRDDPDHDEPWDHMQLMVRYAAMNRPDELRHHDIMLKRLAVANFGAVHQTGIQVTNLLLNVLGSDAQYDTVATLRAEAADVLGPDPATRWTKAMAARMVRADSVTRETLRLNSFGGRAILRKVAVDGFRTDQGVHLPRGTMTSFLGHPAQTDGALQDEPFQYDPFRFSRAREAAEARGGGDAAPVGLVTTSPEYLSFGHGKHACPGRFLVDFEMKMILAYVLRHYDLRFPDEYQGRRPPNQWLAEAVVPPAGAKIQVKRRAV